MDFTQFFNPSAWGSWAPSSFQGLLAPGVQNSPTAPSPGGVMPNGNMTGTAVAPTPAATPNTPGGNIFSSPFLGGSGASGGGTNGGGLGGLFSKGSGANNMMANMGMQMLKPQMPQPPQLQLAKPVGPMQLQGGGGYTPMTGTNASPFNTNVTGTGAGGNPFQQLGMLGGYHF